MCIAGRVLVNGQEAKPAKEVKQGDVITLKFSSRIVDLEIIGMLDSSSRKMPAGRTVPGNIRDALAERNITELTFKKEKHPFLHYLGSLP